MIISKEYLQELKDERERQATEKETLLKNESGLEPDYRNENRDVDFSKLFSYKDPDMKSVFDDDEKHTLLPEFNKAIIEHFDLTDRATSKILTHLNEEAQNTVLSALASKLYDNMMKKCDDIDYGEIPATKGDVTKLSKYDVMKDTLKTMHDLLKEYKQDTGPVDELTVALSNLEARKDLFERAYKYNSEMPMMIYCNVTYGIIVGITFMIASCIEFIKDPGSTSFKMSLDKVAYAKSKDHLIYQSIRKFNKSCEKRELDKAMEAIMKAQIKGVKESTVQLDEGLVLTAAGIAAGVLAVIIGIVMIIRELIFLFYWLRVEMSDLYELQANIGMINVYNLQRDDSFGEERKAKIIKKQLEYVEKYRKLSNKFAVQMKTAEVKAEQEKKEDRKLTISSFGRSSSSALF